MYKHKITKKRLADPTVLIYPTTPLIVKKCYHYRSRQSTEVSMSDSYNGSTKLILKRIQPPTENIQALITTIEIDSKVCRAAEPLRSITTDQEEMNKMDNEIIQGIGTLMKHPQTAASGELLNNTEYKNLSVSLFNFNEKIKEWHSKYDQLQKKYDPLHLKSLAKDPNKVKQAFAEISASATESENLRAEFQTLKEELKGLKKKIDTERIRLFSVAQPPVSRPD